MFGKFMLFGITESIENQIIQLIGTVIASLIVSYIIPNIKFVVLSFIKAKE
jgi:hypothetical protein